jgi:DNA replication protein DnaC
MVDNQLKDRLSQMRLKGLLNAYLLQRDDLAAKDRSFEERFGLLVDFEWTHRQNKRLARLIKESGMNGNACIEDLDFTARRNLDRRLINSLTSCEWLIQHQNIIISGPTGVGCAFTHILLLKA